MTSWIFEDDKAVAWQGSCKILCGNATKHNALLRGAGKYRTGCNNNQVDVLRVDLPGQKTSIDPYLRRNKRARNGRAQCFNGPHQLIAQKGETRQHTICAILAASWRAGLVAATGVGRFGHLRLLSVHRWSGDGGNFRAPFGRELRSRLAPLDTAQATQLDRSVIFSTVLHLKNLRHFVLPSQLPSQL